VSSATRSGRRGGIAAAVVAVALAGGGATAVAAGLQGSSGPPRPPLAGPSSAPVAGPSPTTAAPRPAPAAAAPAPAVAHAAPATDLDVRTLSRSRPVGLSVPSIGVDAGSLIELGREADGTLEVPEDFGQAGWFRDGPAPGQFGPAVIAGHVDSRSGPGIFYRLGALRPGARVEVAREDGSTAVFVVDKVERYAKDRFPTRAVYGDTNHRAELRLITCGGEFDTRTGSYVDNVVAYAHLV